jgi:hypothetical protein
VLEATCSATALISLPLELEISRAKTFYAIGANVRPLLEFGSRICSSGGPGYGAYSSYCSTSSLILLLDLYRYCINVDDYRADLK